MNPESSGGGCPAARRSHAAHHRDNLTQHDGLVTVDHDVVGVAWLEIDMTVAAAIP